MQGGDLRLPAETPECSGIPGVGVRHTIGSLADLHVPCPPQLVAKAVFYRVLGPPASDPVKFSLSAAMSRCESGRHCITSRKQTPVAAKHMYVVLRMVRCMGSPSLSHVYASA